MPGTVTAAGNVLAGYWVATGGAALTPAAVALLGASALLYGGGVALNDWCDRRLDAVERPLRPLPSGRVAPRAALAFACALLASGLALAALAGPAAFALAAGIVALIVSYDAVAKNSVVLGPLNMGLLRGLNFLLGMTLVAGALPRLAPVALAHVAFVAGLTLLARGEATGGPRWQAAGGLALATAAYAWLGVLVLPFVGRVDALPFLAAFVALTAWRFGAVALDPKPSKVHVAVKTGVLSLFLLDAALAAAAAGALAGLAVAALVLPALALARAIPVH